MSKSKDKVVGELEFLRHIVSETARMSYPGRFGGKLRAGAKKDIQIHLEKVYPGVLKVQKGNYDAWHKKRVADLSQVIKNGNYRQKENDTSFALSAKLLNTFMHQLMKYEQFRHLYKQLHLPLDRSVFVIICKIIPKDDRTELSCLRELAFRWKNCPYQFNKKDYTRIQKELWRLVEYYNKTVFPENRQICSRIDLNCLLW